MKSYCFYEIETTEEDERNVIYDIFEGYKNFEVVQHRQGSRSADTFCLKFEIDRSESTKEDFYRKVDAAIMDLDYAALKIKRYVPYDFYVYSIFEKGVEETVRGQDYRRRHFRNGKSYEMAFIGQSMPIEPIRAMFKKRINKVKAVMSNYFYLGEKQDGHI